MYRLSQAVAPDSSWGISWTFDVWGNRLSQTPQGLAVTKVGTQRIGYSNTNNIPNNRNASFSYDAAGNQLNDGLHNYSFNAENQITQMDAGTATYAYDGEGQRMKKTVGSENTFYFYGPMGLLCEFTTSDAISSATGASSSDKTLHHTADKLVSAVLVIDSSGLVIENNRMLPYGEPWQAESTPSTNDKKFTSYVRDPETGLDYAMARYYTNRYGRFMSADPAEDADLENPQSWNFYTYVLNDPINFVDEDGLQVSVPVSNGGNPYSCLNQAVIPYLKANGVNTSGPDFLSNFFNSATGNLALTLYFEDSRGSVQLYQAIAQTMANRFQLAQHDPKLAEQLLSISNRNRFVLPNGSNEDQIKWVIQHSSGVWNGSDLAPGLQNTLKGVLDADIRVPGNSIGLQDCANLIRAMSVGFDAFKPKGFGGGNLFTGTDVMYRVPGLTRNTLWFSSGGSPVNRNLWRVSTFSIAGGSFVARRRVTWTFYNYLGKR